MLTRRSKRLCLLALAAASLSPLACRAGGAGSGQPEATPSAVASLSSSTASAPSASPTASAPAPEETNYILPAASVSAFQNPMHLPEYDGPTGSVEGTITVTGDPSPDFEMDFSACPGARDTYQKVFREGPPLPSGARPLGDALVTVTGYSGFYIPGKSDVRSITIQNCAFSARTIDMTIGQRLEVANKSRMLYAPGFAQIQTPAKMIAPPGADAVKLYPPKPAYYTLVDEIGAKYMSANVYVLMYPLHTVSTLDGRYRIDGVPVGKVQVSSRLAAIQRSATKSVEVHKGVVEHVDLELTYRQPNKGIPKPVNGGPPLTP